MSPKKIEEKLQKMNDSLKERDIINDFPSILDDLEYIIKDYDEEVSKLTNDQRINHIYDIEYKKIDYLAELIRRYMEITWKKEFSYEIVEGYLFSSTAGYNQERDIVTISIFGILVNSLNLADSIKTIGHEFRHQQQFHFLHEKEFKDLLDYPPYFITIAKNLIPKEINVIKNEEGCIIDKPYYTDNYKRLYMEVDANTYGLELSRNLLTDLYEMYPDKNKELEKRVRKLQNILFQESKLVEENFKEENRTDQTLVDEIYTSKPITSTVIVDNTRKDSLIYIDKLIKEHPEIKERFEVLNILTTDYDQKYYWSIILDKYKKIQDFGHRNQICEIYDNIVKTDPLLLITKYMTEQNNKALYEFIREHPTFTEEYKDEINEIINSYMLGFDTLNLLTPEEDFVYRKERK